MVDAGVLQALIVLQHANPYAARIISFLAAASTTWLINRHYTFGVSQKPTRSEWTRYIGLMTAGAVINYGIYSIYIEYWDAGLAYPWLGVAMGSIGAMGLNFVTSRALFQSNKKNK